MSLKLNNSNQRLFNKLAEGVFFCFSVGDAIPAMQTAYETRKARLLLLKKKYGTWSAINRHLNWEATNARLSQIGAGSIRSGRNTPYVMGDEMAREIEAALGLQVGWMDTPLTYAELHGEDDPRTKALQLLDAMSPEQQAIALRVLDALVQPVFTGNQGV